MISGLYANTNLDGKDSPRQKMIQEMEENFRTAIAELYDPTPDIDLTENPFFEPMNVPGGDIDWEKYAEENPDPKKPGIGKLPNNFDDLDIDQM